MTENEETAASEPTIDEQIRAVLANALDQLSSGVPGGKVRWSTTTLPAMLRPVLVDLDRHLQPPNEAPPPPLRDTTLEAAVKRFEAKRREEQRYRWTAGELADALREGR